MQLTQLTVKNFRCFKKSSWNFDSQFVIIEGDNGSGKTSFLEALHYLCYLRSFRTFFTRELINNNSAEFFVKAKFGESSHIQAGFSNHKKVVRVNDKIVKSYKELVNHYQVISMMEEDLNLISGGPDRRRAFLDRFILLSKPENLTLYREYRVILNNRNALLKKKIINQEDYLVWSNKLWQKSQEVRALRLAAMQELIKQLDLLRDSLDKNFDFKFKYQPKEDKFDSFHTFAEAKPNFMRGEEALGRSLFGAHLDDFAVFLSNMSSRTFASRGQKKLLVLLMKLAQVKNLQEKGYRPILLLDDFVTDFDEKRVLLAISLLKDLDCQTIFSSPVRNGPLNKLFKSSSTCHIKL